MRLYEDNFAKKLIMLDPQPIRRNYETDFTFIERFGKRDDAGNFVPILIPEDDVDFVLEIWVNECTSFRASRIDGHYDNCEKLDASRLKVYVPLSKCCLGIGPLRRKLYLRFPNGFFQNAPTQICIPDYCGIFLWDGPSDDADMTPEMQEIFGGMLRGRDGIDGISTFYQIHTKKDNQRDLPYDFYTVIEGVTADNLSAMSDPAKFRFVLMNERKHQNEGRNWRIPMLPYEQSKRTGGNVQSMIAETDTWWPVTGRITPWFRNGRFLDEAVPLTISTNKIRFASTRNIKRRIGVALFQHTGAAGEGWTRISNIAHVELMVCNRKTTPKIRVTVIS